MKLSLEWLSAYVSLEDIAPKALADALTLSGSKVETVTTLGDDIQNVVVGRVVSTTKHPNADRLTICMIDVGGNNGQLPDQQSASTSSSQSQGHLTKQILTAATNVVPGAFVPVALDGAVLPGGQTIKSGKMRGELSEGMLCGGSELGLTEGDEPGAGVDGIFLLPADEDWQPGMNICDALQLRDTVLDFEITNNRPDCLSVTGLARETAATLGRAFAHPKANPQADGDLSDVLTVSIESPLCPRYTARLVKNVNIAPSPRHIRRRLRSSGIRPINNIVDITNYIMLLTGQPMHAFDAACIHEANGATQSSERQSDANNNPSSTNQGNLTRKIIVRTANPGETIETLDGKARNLTESMLVIADPQGATAVAGVMGGAASEITESTRDVIFESACFNGPSVRKTALALAMRTDASSRFEKGLDVTATEDVVNLACDMVAELGAGEVVPGCVDVDNSAPQPEKIPFDPAQINAYLGTDIPEDFMAGALQSLGFTVENNVVCHDEKISEGFLQTAVQTLGFANESKTVVVPMFRSDVHIWQDIAEEVARLYGYDNIPSTLPLCETQGWLTDAQIFRDRTADGCLALGFSEMLTYSFQGAAEDDKVNLPADCIWRKHRPILNPLGEETGVMRTTALPSLLTALARNTAQRNPAAWLFEIATVYLETGERLPEETSHLVLGGYGDNLDFFTLKGAMESLAEHLGISVMFESVTFKRSDHPSFHPGRQVMVYVGVPFTLDGREATASDYDGKAVKGIGILGEVHPDVAQNYDLSSRIYALEINLGVLQSAAAPTVFAPLPKFPALTRDLALVAAKTQTHAEIHAAIWRAGGALLADCSLFDVFEGGNLAADQKSMAYNLVFRAEDRTLTDDEADKAIQKILKALEHTMQVTLRS